jgi:hypothetical protein
MNSPESSPDLARSASWLKKLQTESWQAEILLSGLIIYALLQAPEAIVRFHHWLEVNYLYSGDEKNAAAFATVAVYWLSGGFILHLVLRGVWASYIGLSYLFPGGVSEEDVPLTPRFHRFLHPLVKPARRVEQLENICSGLFGLSFYLFVSLAGLTLFYLALNVFFYVTHFYVENITGNWFFRIGMMVIFAICLLYLLDFLTLGRMKRWRWVAPWYYPIYRLAGWIFLAPLYRDLYYLFIVHLKRRYLALGLAAYTLITFFLFIRVETRYFHNIHHNLQLFPSYLKSPTLHLSSMYDSNNEEVPVSQASIQDEVIRDGLLRLSFRPNVRNDERSLKYCQDKLKGSTQKISGPDCLTSYYRVGLDSTELPPVSWHYYYYESHETKLYRTYLRVDTLSPGPHRVWIKVDDKPLASIPFFKN